MPVRCPRTCGREAEVALLRHVLEETATGRGGLMLLTGQAGIGKSRLVTDAVQAAETMGLQTAVGRAAPVTARTPFRPLAQSLMNLLRGRPIPSDQEFEPWRAPLGAIVPDLVRDAHAGQSSTAARGEALLQLLGRLTRESGAVVVLEDLHWADPETLGLLEYVSDAVTSHPVAWLLTCRDDEPGTPAANLVARLRGRRGVSHLKRCRAFASGMFSPGKP